jgi:outer membrane protein OmpA-like peptidoglycan-associated protein
MTEKLGIIIGIASFIGFSVFCTWHHVMPPGTPLFHPHTLPPPAVSLEPPFPPAALPSSAPVVSTPPTPTPSPEAAVEVPVSSTPSPPSEPQSREETHPRPASYALRGKVIEFYADSDALSAKGRVALDAILPTLRSRPTTRVEITGHTDNLGSEDYNLALSQRRAEAVRQYLLAQGIAEEQLSTGAYGSSLPIADNATPEGRQRNRRAEVIVHSDSKGS